MACMERSVEELGRPHGFLRSQAQLARHKADEAPQGKPGNRENALSLTVMIRKRQVGDLNREGKGDRRSLGSRISP
jgi:hypothetical protein